MWTHFVIHEHTQYTHFMNNEIQIIHWDLCVCFERLFHYVRWHTVLCVVRYSSTAFSLHFRSLINIWQKHIDTLVGSWSCNNIPLLAECWCCRKRANERARKRWNDCFCCHCHCTYCFVDLWLVFCCILPSAPSLFNHFIPVTIKKTIISMRELWI